MKKWWTRWQSEYTVLGPNRVFREIASTPSITTYPSWVLWLDIFDLLVVAYARVSTTRLLSFVVAFLIMWKCTVIMYMHGYGGDCTNTFDYYLPKLGIMNGYLRFVGCSICYGRCNSFAVLRCGFFLSLIHISEPTRPY